MVPCEPGLQVVFEDGRVLPWWSTHERTAEEIRRISPPTPTRSAA